MRSFQAIIAVADISGYTRFVMLHKTAIAHAEEIISELLETVTANAKTPLQLHKLEGDAAFLYTEVTGSQDDAVQDVMQQVVAFMKAFEKKKTALFNKSVGGCICSACQSIETLELKTVVHIGDVLEKEMSGFTELAGEPVIVAHRLMKNGLDQKSYVLVTDVIAARLDADPYESSQQVVEHVEDVGDVGAVAYFPQVSVLDRKGVRPLARPSSYPEIIRLFVASAHSKLRGLNRFYRNMPR
ncbi:MAG: DUF2652 domain-containing protein [Sulfitobacter sp.]